MTTSYASDHVRHWTLEEAREELDRLTREIEKSGMTITEFRYRASEWGLDRREQKLLGAYERMARMVAFAAGARPDCLMGRNWRKAY